MAFNSLLFLHVFTHVVQSLYLKMYTPGVVSAVLVTLPYSVYLFYRLISEQLVTWGQAALSIPAGFLLIPIVMLGHELGKRLVPAR